MARSSAPPLDGQAIRRARVLKFLTQEEVAALVAGPCAEFGIKFDRSSLSLIENGKVVRPSLKVIPVLAEVLGMKPEEMFASEEAA
jgi:transcriptional regulator with XRE-family HTH domain